MFDFKTTDQPSILFGHSSRWLKIFLLVMFLLAALIRRDEIQAPGFGLTREYTSAIIARSYYFNDNDNIASWRQDIATSNKNQQPILEPPLTEYLTSIIYRIIGNEEIWYARHLTIFFWLIGGVYMYKITKNILSVDEALIATAYYLFTPMSIIVSRSVQPEALMMMMYMISLHSIIIYFETPTKNRLIMAATLAGFTVLIRPLVIFIIYFSFVALSIHKKRNIPKIIDQSFFVFFGISFMIPFVYYGYGLFVTDFMRWKVPHSFRPYLLTHWEFWKGWFDNGVNVLGHSAIAIATLGFFFIKKRFTQILVIGMSIGYIVFGLVFNYHIMTHSYYQMQFIPIVGICVAPLLENILGSLKKSGNRLFLVPITVVLSLGLYFAYKDVQESLYKPVFEPPSIAKEIGDAINHSSKVVTVAYGYGLPLTYYGEFSGTWWPENEHKLFRHPDEEEGSVQERLKLLGFQPEYFVITNFDRYTRYNKDLQEYLTGNCSILRETDTYLIYTSCKLQNNFY